MTWRTGELSSQEKRALLASLLRDKAQRTVAAMPMSHGQKALWLLQRRAPANAAYNTAFAIRVRSRIDAAALRAALQAVVARHAALRTTFSVESGKPVAVTRAHQDVHLTLVDARARTDEALQQWVAEDYRRPFDLERGPLMRASLFSRAEDDHVLLLAVHHIACDAWSMWTLMHELSVLYPAAIAGRPLELPLVAAQYPDFVRWQTQLLEGPEGERLWRYWHDQLAGELPIIDLPTSRPRPATQTLRGTSHAFRIDGSLARDLAALGKTQGATLFVCLLAVFQTLLHRYSGQDDIIVGSPLAGRTNPDMAATIGYFANPLPLRTDLSGDPGFRELVGRVRQTVLGAIAHQDFPFPLLIERLNPKRDPSRWPVIEILFVLQRPPNSQEFASVLDGAAADRIQWGDLQVEPFDLAQMEGQFDLTWEVVEARESLSCVLKYNPDLFDPDVVRRMEGHLQTLIRAAVDDPDQRLSRLPLMTSAETVCVLREWQGAETAYPLQHCLHHWIEKQVERSPDKIAVTMADGSGRLLTYRDLNRRANQVARHLQSLGVGSNQVVGVLAERSPEMVIALLGILKAGAAYLPLDPEYPYQRLDFMVADARASALLTHGDLADQMPELACPAVRLDGDAEALARHDPVNVTSDVGPNDLAYVIYTSGSTGQPKGVENTHRGICNRLLWMQDAFQLDESDRVLQKTPFSFDVSVWEFFWPLMTGATLVMARPAGHRDRDYLVETIAGERITTLHFVPSMLQVFLGARALRRCQAPLRRVFCSGEALPFKLQQQFFERFDAAEVKLINLYGPTEAAVDVTRWDCQRDSALTVVPIGRPIANMRTYILDRNLQPVPVGVPGELYLAGVGLARGYRNRPELTEDRFIWHRLDDGAAERLYRTGDLCRWMPDGSIEYLRRLDFQVKLRGFRIELGEIEAALSSHPAVSEAVARMDKAGDSGQLAVWIVTGGEEPPSARELREFLKERLPDYMIPAIFVPLATLPLSPNGKVDRAALPLPVPSTTLARASPLLRSATERRIEEIWRAALDGREAGYDDNFFDLGGHSLLLADVQTRLVEAFGKAPSMIEMFQLTTIRALARFYTAPPLPAATGLVAANGAAAADEETIGLARHRATDIAIIGMAGRFPGAGSVDELWRNLCAGVESITTFDADALAAAGVERQLLDDPNYVRAFGALAGIEQFDAGFFGVTPREAQLMDVQHRLLMECAASALQDAGHDAQAEQRRYGLFAGVGTNRYFINNLAPHRDLMASADAYQLMLGNDKDFAPTRASYKLDLKGPSVSVQTACSTSLVAVHLACRSLRAHECDAALAGGCSVALPQDRGYLYQEGMILSPDGHCRAFDAAARGTVGGNGVALVVLKRLGDALADGDDIYAVIKGSAINNDGGAKAGFTAPGVAGQEAVISAALADAGVTADTIGYVEAHGTGTPLGDPIEIAALRRVFNPAMAPPGGCAIGSVKTNLGHLDTAAGVTGLIKAALAVKHARVPPSLHCQTPISELAGSPFFVPAHPWPWTAGDRPRRAGISSFGIGGTNAHVVIEQARDPPPSGPSRPCQLLILSTQQPSALEAATVELTQHLRDHPELPLADVAFTLACGRRPLRYRRMLVCRTLAEATRALDLTTDGDGGTPVKLHTSSAEDAGGSTAFMFPGQSSQYVNMAADLYDGEPVFRAHVDRCADLLRDQLNLDLRDVLYPAGARTVPAEETLNQTAIAQPALFVIEYALAQLWMSWGVRPEAMIGHSLGEYVAACLAGVWSVEDALGLVALRGALMQQQPTGGMVAVSLSETDVRPLLGPELSLAAVNGPGLCVISGPHDAIAGVIRKLASSDVACRLLQTSHAFHSAMMEPAVAPFLARLRRIECRPPTIPIVSNVTGTWLEAEQAVDPDYWARHLRCTVRFADGLETLLRQPERGVIEIGPGHTLATFASRHATSSGAPVVVTSLRHSQQTGSDVAHMMEAAGRLWLAGTPIDWPAFYAGQQRRRLHLPTYPFQRERCWIDPPEIEAGIGAAPERRKSIGEWLYVPSWQRTPPPVGAPVPGTRWLLLMDEHGTGDALAARLRRSNISAVRVYAGPRFAPTSPEEYVLDPGSRSDYAKLIEDLHRSDALPDVVLHLWNVTAPEDAPLSSAARRDRSLHSLLFLAQALGDRNDAGPCRIMVISTQLHEVTGEEELDPFKALLLAPVTVIHQEYAHLTCSSIDIDLAPAYRDEQIGVLLAETASPNSHLIAYRGRHRWEQIFVPALLPEGPPAVREGGTYLITGGTGGVGLAMAEWLAQAAPGVRLALVARSAPETIDRTGSRSDGASSPAPAVGYTLPGFARLQKLGAEVVTIQADVTDPAQMQRAVERIRQHCGDIRGVIHAAGIAGGGLIEVKTREAAEAEMAAKVDGTLVLDTVLAGAPLDFFVLCSSLTSATGGFGQVAYGAANAFQDAFAQARTMRGARGRTLSIGWDRWQHLGMAAALEARHREFTGEELAGGMSAAEGVEVFGRIIGSAVSGRIIVSTRDLPALVKEARSWQLGRLEQQMRQLPRQPRPRAGRAYVAPESEIERLIAELWQEELGIEPVGTQDDFFALGGDSLLGIKLTSRLRQALHVPLNLRALYEAPTISALAEHVTSIRWVARSSAPIEAAEEHEEGVL